MNDRGPTPNGIHYDDEPETMPLSITQVDEVAASAADAYDDEDTTYDERRVIATLNSLEGRDSEANHGFADALLLAVAHPAVKRAYEALVARQQRGWHCS
jgi:hypothetical protein